MEVVVRLVGRPFSITLEHEGIGATFIAIRPQLTIEKSDQAFLGDGCNKPSISRVDRAMGDTA